MPRDYDTLFRGLNDLCDDLEKAHGVYHDSAEDELNFLIAVFNETLCEVGRLVREQGEADEEISN
jgi:hypothetical protein